MVNTHITLVPVTCVHCGHGVLRVFSTSPDQGTMRVRCQRCGKTHRRVMRYAYTYQLVEICIGDELAPGH